MEKPVAILYTSHAGHTKAYAEMLGRKTGLPVYALDSSRGKVAPKAPILYMGWLMGGMVSGYKKARKTYSIVALCGVGMFRDETHLEEMREKNEIPPFLPLFLLQGGFEMEKTHGIYRLMMQALKKGVEKTQTQKEKPTEEDKEMLSLLLDGRNMVNEDEMSGVLAWFQKIE